MKDLKGAVDMVDKNREKFPHITDEELGTRKLFVDQSQRSLNEVKSGMEAPSVRRKMEEDESRARRTAASTGAREDARTSDNSRYDPLNFTHSIPQSYFLSELIHTPHHHHHPFVLIL